MFVDVPKASADAPTGSAMQDEELLSMVANPLHWARCGSDSIKTLPFLTTQHSVHRERERVHVFAREEAGGILVGVKDSRYPYLDIPGILLRRAIAPYDDGFTLTGRGVLETRACNAIVANAALNGGVERMTDAMAALHTVDSAVRVTVHPFMYGSIFDQAFPEWEAFTGSDQQAAEEAGNSPRP